MHQRLFLLLFVLLSSAIVSCKEQTQSLPSVTSGQSASAEEHAQAKEFARRFWSTSRVEECNESLSSLCHSLLAIKSEHFHQLIYVNVDEVTLGFDGVVIRKVT